MSKKKLQLCKVWYALMPSRCSLLIQRCYPMMLDHLLFSWKILKYTHKVWAFDMFKSSIWTQKCNKTHKSFALLVTVTVSSNCLIIVCLSFAKRQHFFVQGWVLKCSIFCVRHNTNKMKQGLTMETWPLYDDMRIIIWWYDDPHMISRWWQEVAQMICVQEIFGCNGYKLKTSQELRMLSWSLSDCKSLTPNVMIQVSQFVSCF